jgi:LSD1 subclass zinc finger protein
VGDVHAAEVPAAAAIVAVHDVAVGQDVGEGAFLAELAVALRFVSNHLTNGGGCATLVKYLQGARSVMGSSECRNGQAFPAWHAPCR